jgi:hypothetical protein
MEVKKLKKKKEESENKEFRQRNLKLFDYHMRKAREALLRVEKAGGCVDFGYQDESRGSWGCQIIHHYDCKDALAEIIWETVNSFKREDMEPNSLDGIEANPKEW